MMAHLTLAGAIHAALALLCVAVGFIQFLRPKRGAGHRARGYFYVYAMLVTDGTALLVYQLTGQFNAFHVGAIGNFICIVLAIVPLLRSPRPTNWRQAHYYFIAWSYVSLMSAAATEIVGRLGLVKRSQIGWAALVISLATMSLAYVLIRRNRPAPEAPSVPAGLVESSGVTP